MKITTFGNKRILLEFKTQKELTLHMWRFSEYFEGEDGIKGKKFTFDEFVDKYSDKKGNLDYFAYWEGYNIPMKDFLAFISEYRNELSKREREVMKAVISNGISKDGYIIACKEGDKITLLHENVHGLFFENEEYRKEASLLVDNLPSLFKIKLFEALKDKHYDIDVMIDEINAYFVAWNKDDYKDIFRPYIKVGSLTKYIKEAKLLYDKHQRSNSGS